MENLIVRSHRPHATTCPLRIHSDCSVESSGSYSQNRPARDGAEETSQSNAPLAKQSGCLAHCRNFDGVHDQRTCSEAASHAAVAHPSRQSSKLGFAQRPWRKLISPRASRITRVPFCGSSRCVQTHLQTQPPPSPVHRNSP